MDKICYEYSLGTSLKSGHVELMVHRRCLNDDAFGVGEALNEEEFGQGLVARGTLKVTLTDTTDESQTNVRKETIKNLLEPWKFYSDLTGISFETLQKNYNLVYSSASDSYKIDESVHVLSLEPWKNEEDKLLLRLENIAEKSESSNLVKSVDIEKLLDKFNVLNLEEVTLDGNVPISQRKRLEINKEAIEETNNITRDLSVTLKPMEIKTFVVTIGRTDKRFS